MRFLPLLPLILAIGCTTPDESGGDSKDPKVNDLVGFSAEIRAQRPVPEIAFAIQPANDDGADKVPMNCEGDLCSVQITEPGEWRLWGTAPGFVVTYNKVTAATEDGTVASVTLDEFGDYGIDLNDLTYEDSSDGETYKVATSYFGGEVVLDGLLMPDIPMSGYEFEGAVPGHPYTVSGEIAEDLSVINYSTFRNEDGSLVAERIFTLISE